MRAQHAGYDDQIFAWDNPPPGGHPGEAYGCRCWAEPVIEGIEPGHPDAIEPVYPELILIPVSKAGKAIKLILKTTKEAWEEANSPQKPADILNPGGEPIGTQGNRPGIRVENGGKDAAEQLFNRLSKGGKPETPTGYPGKGTRLPNGDWVGYRPQSKSGDAAIDINMKKVPFDKIHFP